MDASFLPAPGRSQFQPGPMHPLAFALDGLAIGVLLLTRRGRVIFASRRARHLLSDADGVAVGPSGLVISDPACAREFSALLAAAIDEGTGGALVVPRPSGVVGYQATIGAIPPGQSTEACCAVLLMDPIDAPGGLAGRFARLYGLTPAQAEVAGLLVQGYDLMQISEQRGTSRWTTRAHLDAVFEAVGARRQVDLVRVLSAAAMCGYEQGAQGVASPLGR